MVKPGKGQAFNRVRVRNLKTGRTIERTWKSGDTVEAADVVDTDMQYLYSDGDFFHFMVPDTFEQLTASKEAVGEGAQWLKDGTVCVITLWNGVPLQVTPPAHMELKVDRDRSRPARRHRDRRIEAGQARDRRHGARAAVHQRGRDRCASTRAPASICRAARAEARGGSGPQALSIENAIASASEAAPTAQRHQTVEAQGHAGAVGHAGPRARASSRSSRRGCGRPRARRTARSA